MTILYQIKNFSCRLLNLPPDFLYSWAPNRKGLENSSKLNKEGGKEAGEVWKILGNLMQIANFIWYTKIEYKEAEASIRQSRVHKYLLKQNLSRLLIWWRIAVTRKNLEIKKLPFIEKFICLAILSVQSVYKFPEMCLSYSLNYTTNSSYFCKVTLVVGF